MSRTTVTIDDEVKNEAQHKGMNISAIAEAAIEEKLTEHEYRLVNTNIQGLPEGLDGTEVYAENIAAAYGPERFGEQLAKIDQGDWIFSYRSEGVGIRAVGIALDDATAEPVDQEDRVIVPLDSEIEEYHVPVRWKIVLPEQNAITPEEVEAICHRPVYAGGTEHKITNDNPELLFDVMVGRQYRV